ncbi:uncharacterized protein [Henckelia pumila]|uniref:uncharacterized protein n=1 Tax=Henckelia pumila TaxID=405737 RepID=UPI003C6E6B5F
MAFKWAAVFAVLLAAELVGYAAAATYVVGDSFGWGIPPDGGATYVNYAAQHAFEVGDVLVFNFTTGAHDVARVTKSAYDGCSSNSPISLATVGPASVTLNTAGADYYICTFGQHCSLGQKLAINVTAAKTSPSPAPALPPTSPSTTPSPAPIVAPPTATPSPTPGGSVTPPAPAPAPGSLISPPAPFPGTTPPPASTPPTSELTPPPPPSSAPIRTSGVALSVVFASMIIGVIMIYKCHHHHIAHTFIYIIHIHNSHQIRNWERFGATRDTKNTEVVNMAARLGISNIIFMTLVVMATLSSAQTTHVVGDALGWTFPPGGEVAYRTWAATQSFAVGDVLVFNFTTGSHDVAEVSKDSFDSCNGNNPISRSTNGPASITLTSSGEHHFICTFTGHCDAGMKLSVDVVGSPAAVSPAPSPAATTTPPPVATPAPAPARAAMTYTVGDSLGWTVPPGGPVAYQAWARGKSFVVGDTLIFNFTTNEHDVVQVTKEEFDSCSTASTAIITTGPARITLNSSGEHYYICTIPRHCSFGQKLAINVTAAGATVTPRPSQAPSPSSGPTPPPPSSVTPVSPSTPSTTPPSGATTAPPPPGDSSAPSLAVATLPLTFLAVAFAVLYN